MKSLHSVTGRMVTSLFHSLGITVILPFLSTHWIVHTQILSTIEYMISSSNHLMITFLAASWIGGFNLLSSTILCLWSGMCWIFWEQILGEIPTMFAIVQPIACLNLLNTTTKHFICCPFKSATIIACKMSPILMKTYFKRGGRALTFNFGAS